MFITSVSNLKSHWCCTEGAMWLLHVYWLASPLRDAEFREPSTSIEVASKSLLCPSGRSHPLWYIYKPYTPWKNILLATEQEHEGIQSPWWECLSQFLLFLLKNLSYLLFLSLHFWNSCVSQKTPVSFVLGRMDIGSWRQTWKKNEGRTIGYTQLLHRATQVPPNLMQIILHDCYVNGVQGRFEPASDHPRQGSKNRVSKGTTKFLEFYGVYLQ